MMKCDNELTESEIGRQMLDVKDGLQTIADNLPIDCELI